MSCLSIRSGVLALALAAGSAMAAAPRTGSTVEPHQRLDVSAPAHARDVALTLDACGGAFDRALIATLVRLRVPATLFVTQRWIARNPTGLRELLDHPELFQIENHGRDHVPAVVGGRVYGLQGPADLAGVEREIDGGAEAVTVATGRAPAWYRGAGAAYDAAGLRAIEARGLRVAGFSLNADDGATAPAARVAQRLRRIAPGDIVIAHMNRPGSGTAAGFAAALPELLARGTVFVTLAQAGGVR